MPEVEIGSVKHKELLCRELIDTHLAYDVATLQWPALDPASLDRLRTLPFWEEAISTERSTAAKVQAQARLENDPLLREAVALQGYEEERHSTLLASLLTHYDIRVPLQPSPPYPPTLSGRFCGPNMANVSIHFSPLASSRSRKTQASSPLSWSRCLNQSCKKKPFIFYFSSTG